MIKPEKTIKSMFIKSLFGKHSSYGLKYISMCEIIANYSSKLKVGKIGYKKIIYL